MPDKKGQNLSDLIYGQPTHGDSPGMQAGGLAKALRALTAVEKEANKAKFLEPSKTQMRLYHGTTATEGGKGQEAIRRIKPSKEGSLGSGVYLTPSAAHSSTYSGSPNEEAIQMLLADKHSADIGRQFLQNQQAGNVLPGQIGGNMLPVYAQVKNPLILEGTHADPMIEALVKLGMDEDKAARMVERAYENKGYIGKEVENRARAAGYDGLMQYRNGDLSEVVVYNPNAVKSAIGNQGTYDITKPGLSEAKGGAIHMDKGGAAFGVFPQMKPRRSRQDPEAAKQVPVDLARGFAAGALGMPGDVESLIRLLPGLSEETILPTSEDILKRIPGGSDTPASRAASGLGILGGGFYTGPGSAARAVSSVAGALPKAARDFVQAAGQPAVNVIKPKGGNWLTGSVEKSLAPLKSTTIAGETPAQRIPKHEQLLQDPSLSAESRAAVERHLNEEKQRAAIDNWIDRNLANYVKKEMATPEDPVRKLAEQGILHIDPQVPRIDEMNAQLHRGTFRQSYGEDAASVMGQSELARKWEDLTDAAVDPHMAGMLRAYESENVLGANPWIQKLPEKELVSSLKRENVEGLGFDHIIDVLREDLATGRIRPEQLNKVSMEQAVRRTYEYDQELAKRMAEATAAARAGLPVYKEYPEKYRWIELNRPGAFASESEAMGHSVRGYEPPKGHPDWTPASGDSGSPSYGHGGWEAIKSGRAKVYSLVDEKGQPHVTVEAKRGKPWNERSGIFYDNPELEDSWRQFSTEASLAEKGKRPSNYIIRYPEWLQKTHPDLYQKYEKVFEPSPPEITQIKGKQNAAPKEEYLPFVQDFVKSGQWSDVGDITNANLEKANWTIKPQEVEQLKSMGIDVPDYVTPDERLNLIRKVRGKSPEDMKHGGRVHISNNPDTMRLELAGGGGVDRLTPQDMLYLTSQPDFAKMSAQQQREAVVNMGDRELSERLKGKMAEGGAAFGAYTTGKKYQAAKKRAEEADVNLLKDPKTYAAVMGLLGTAPDEQGFSVLHPEYEGIKKAGEAGFVGGTALGLAPAAKPVLQAGKALAKAAAPKAGQALEQYMMERGMALPMATYQDSPSKVKKFVYPQESALERARQNAVKLLGLPENNTPEMRAKAMGYMDYLHGTERMDRLLEGKTLDPRRATSGPMPYGTTTPELASSYATSKADTSRRATDEGDVRKYFEVAPKDIGVKGIRSPIPVERAWYFMSPEQKAKIQNLAPRVGYENLDEFTGNFIVHPEGVNATLSPNQWDWFMKNEAKGNPLTALREMWYSSGQLVDEPERLAEIYRLAGIDAPISQTKAPWTEAQGVLLGKARITNPIDTSNTEQVSALIEPLKQAFAKDRSKTKIGGPDQWAKESRYTPKTWVAELEKDLSEGKESYVWTSIPDKVTAELKKLGFNGIIDRSGKGGGAKEPVVIPFDPSQVRSRFAAFDPAEMEAADLLKAYGGAIKKAPGGEVTVPDMTDGGKVIDGGPFKKGGKVQFTDNLDTMRLAVGRK